MTGKSQNKAVVSVYAIVAVNLVIAGYTAITKAAIPVAYNSMVSEWAFLPFFLTDSLMHLDTGHVVSSVVRMISYTYLHGDWSHVLGNMFFLLLFGRLVERELGTLSFWAFYTAAGVGGAVGHWLFNFNDISPLIGASGAISGVMGAYLAVVIFTKSGRSILAIGGALFIIKWLFEQVYLTVTSSVAHAPDNVAYLAHAGGFLFGYLLMRSLVRSRHVEPPAPPPVRIEPHFEK